MTTERRLADQVVVVTGAAGGIGPAIVARLAADGAAVAVAHLPSDSEAAAAAGIVSQVQAGGGRATSVAADISREADVAGMIAAAETALGPVSSLVCNAATSVTGQHPWHEIGAEEWARVLAVNVTGTYLCVRHAREGLETAGGSVVVMSSVTPLLGRPGNLAYVTSKAAVIGMVRSLARELGPSGVRVNAIAPGAIKTPAEAFYGTEEELEDMMYPLQSLHRRGEPHDVAGAVAFLVGPDSGFVTGQVLVVDGGWVMP